MRESIKITRKYQFGYMLLKHVTTVFFILLIELLIFGQLLTMNIVKNIMAGIMIFCYSVSMYTSSNTLASKDMKPYTPLKADIKFGFLWGVTISATIAVVYVFYRINWTVFATEGSMVGIWPVLYNVFYMFWTAPYFGLSSSEGGSVPYYVVAIMLIIPPVMTTMGYYTAVKKIYLSDKLIAFMHEKGDK